MKIVDSKKWHNVLKWDHMPNFQTCHRNKEDESFEAEYYEDVEITNLLNNVFDLFQSEGSSNARLTGKMGSGKTTFLHYIKRIISKKAISDKVCFTIIRAGRVDTTDFRESLRGLIIEKSFKVFFKDAGYGDDFNRINEQQISRQEKINRLFYFYADSSSSFKKSLIVVLDDMDTVKDENDIKNIIVAFKGIGGSGQAINKWVSLRETTFKNYSEELHNELTFFQQPFILPQVSLFEIVKKRISYKNDNGINPFSNDLCKKILKLKNGSIRDALGILSMILHYTNPPQKNQSEAIIQNWFEKSAITTLLKQNEVPNIHTEEFITVFNYPIAYDLLHIIQFTHIKSHIFSITGKIATYYRGQDFDGIFRLLENQLDPILDILLSNNLITFQHNIYKLTYRAKIIVSFSQEHYNKTCEAISKNDLEDMDESYWSTLSKQINYKKYVEDVNINRTIRLNV